MERYVATQFYKADSPESRILRESGIAPSEFVLAADAQATIAALQADNRTYINERHEHVKQIEQLQSQLTQRTAELEAANDKVQFLEKKNRNLLDSENLTLKVKADQDVRLASLQAELERVRAALEDACLSVAVHGEQPPQKWLDALQHRQGMEGVCDSSPEKPSCTPSCAYCNDPFYGHKGHR